MSGNITIEVLGCSRGEECGAKIMLAAAIGALGPDTFVGTPTTCFAPGCGRKGTPKVEDAQKIVVDMQPDPSAQHELREPKAPYN